MREKFLRRRSHFLPIFLLGALLCFGAVPALAADVDTTYLVDTDFDTYDMGMKIQFITEDAENYSVTYAYETVEVVGLAWQRAPKVASMRIAKKELGERDLGLYIADQLDQVVKQQVEYLKTVQKEEKKTGEAESSVSTEYAGLIGQSLNSNEKTFEGYQPVKQLVAETAPVVTDSARRAMGASEGSAHEVVSEVAPVDSSSDASALDELASKIAALEEKMNILTQLVDALTEFYTTFNFASFLGRDGA